MPKNKPLPTSYDQPSSSTHPQTLSHSACDSLLTSPHTNKHKTKTKAKQNTQIQTSRFEQGHSPSTVNRIKFPSKREIKKKRLSIKIKIIKIKVAFIIEIKIKISRRKKRWGRG